MQRWDCPTLLYQVKDVQHCLARGFMDQKALGQWRPAVSEVDTTCQQVWSNLRSFTQYCVK